MLHQLRLTGQLEASRFEALAARRDVDARRPALSLQCVNHVTDHPNQVRSRLQMLEFVDLKTLGQQDDVGNG
ncbi:MAG: hypothetical protein WBC13_16215 [Dokdonella sp.]